MILIKLNDIIFNIDKVKQQAVKKSIEFFIGGYVEQNDIDEFNEKKGLNDLDLLRKFLESKKIYLRDIALQKKLNEYLFGKEFNGLISRTELLVEKDLLNKISSSVLFLSLMSKDATEFLLEKNNLKLNVVYFDNPLNAVSKLKNKVKKFIGTTTEDYEAAVKNKVQFIGYKTDIADEKIEELEELF